MVFDKNKQTMTLQSRVKAHYERPAVKQQPVKNKPKLKTKKTASKK
jgi:hypothetical protein